MPCLVSARPHCPKQSSAARNGNPHTLTTIKRTRRPTHRHIEMLQQWWIKMDIHFIKCSACWTPAFVCCVCSDQTLNQTLNQKLNQNLACSTVAYSRLANGSGPENQTLKPNSKNEVLLPISSSIRTGILASVNAQWINRTYLICSPFATDRLDARNGHPTDHAGSPLPEFQAFILNAC